MVNIKAIREASNQYEAHRLHSHDDTVSNAVIEIQRRIKNAKIDRNNGLPDMVNFWEQVLAELYNIK